MPIYPGKLNQRITIEQRTTTQDPDTGEVVESWVTLASVWASFDPLSVREFIQSSATQSEVSARFTIRHRDDVDATMRITHRGKVWNIAGVLPDNETGLEWLTLPVSEGVNDGG